MTDRFNRIINSSTPVLVDFSAEWCAPCRMMAPVLRQLKDRTGEELRIIKIDIDKNNQLASLFNIRSVPTLMLFRNGTVLWSGSGIMTSDYLKNVIDNYSNFASAEKISS